MKSAWQDHHKWAYKWSVRFLLALFVVTLLACAPTRGIDPLQKRPELDELTSALALAVKEFDSVKGLAKITYKQNGDRKAANHVVIASYPESLRLETLNLFGSPAMMASTNDNRAVVLFPGQAKAYVGPASSGFLRKVTRLPLTSKMVISIILRRPDLLTGQQKSLEYLPDGISRLLLTDGRLSQQLDFDQQRHLVRVAYLADGQVVSTIRYADYNNRFPHLVEIDMSEGTVQVKIDFSDIESNVTLDDELFRLIPSAAYQVEPFPELY